MTETVSYNRQSARLDGDEGHCPKEIENPAPARVLFIEAAWQYTLAGGDAYYLIDLCMLMQGRYLDEIDQGFIDRVASRTCRGMANSTANRRVYTPISAVLKFSARQGWCKSFRISRPRATKRSSPLPPTEEVDRFINAAGPSLRHILIYLISTGRTVRETLGLDWQQVNLAHATAQLRNSSGQITTVTLPPRVVEMLARFIHRGGKVFRRPDGAPYSEKLSAGGQLKKAIEGAQRRSGVRITPRMLRHIWRSRSSDD